MAWVAQQFDWCMKLAALVLDLTAVLRVKAMGIEGKERRRTSVHIKERAGVTG